MSTPAVEFHGVEWSVPGRKVLLGVTVDVMPGEFLGVVGPNGSGKTSLLRCAYRVNRPSAGSVRVGGLDVATCSPTEVARQVAVVPQERPDAFELTVREVVMQGRIPHKRYLQGVSAKDTEAVEQALSIVEMCGFAPRVFRTLSGGEKQSVLIARALAQETPTIIFDEPTAGLDVAHQFRLMRLLRELPKTKIAALHDLPLAARYCDRVLVLRDGVVAALGPSWDVLTPALIAEVFGVTAQITTDGRASTLALVDLTG